MQHKGMSTLPGVSATVIDGAVLAQRTEHHVHPLLVGIIIGAVIVVTLIARGLVESEVLAQTLGSILRIGTTAAFCSAAILHVSCHAAVAHQRSHSQCLFIGVLSVVILVEHVVPVVIGVAKVS